MKGCKEFTYKSSVRIIELLSELELANREEQKKIRAELRMTHGFFISDFTSSKSRFNKASFHKLIEKGRIRIVPDRNPIDYHIILGNEYLFKSILSEY